MAIFTGSSLYHSSKRPPSPSPISLTPNAPPATITTTPSADIGPGSASNHTPADGIVQAEAKIKVEDLKIRVSSAKTPRPSKRGVSKQTKRVTTQEERNTILAMALAGVGPSKIASTLNLKANTVAKFVRSKQKAWLAANGTAPSSPLVSSKKVSSKHKI